MPKNPEFWFAPACTYLIVVALVETVSNDCVGEVS